MDERNFVVWAGESERNSTRDSTGIAHVIYLAGCKKDCKGCHNPELKERTDNFKKTVVDLEEEIRSNHLSTHVVISGGEPLDQIRAVLRLSRLAKILGKEVWVYTGYTYEEMKGWRIRLQDVDIMVTGPYEEENKNEEYTFLASSNQQVGKRIGPIWYNIDEETLLEGG